MKLPNLNLHGWLAPGTPRLAASTGSNNPPGSTGPVLFSSRSGGDGGDYDDFPDDPETEITESAPEPPRASRRRSRNAAAPGGGSGSGGSGGGGNGSGGRPRTIQFQPEDRYWTEYLRIALPIIGLILMLGLFWYWATQIIGDDTSPDEPVATETVGVVETIAAQPTNEPTATTEIAVVNTPEPTQQTAPTAEPTQGAGGDTTADETPADQETPEDTGDTGGGTFAVDDIAELTDNGVNLRSEPTTAGGDATIVTTLNSGDQVQIIDGPTDADGYTWYQVMVLDGTNSTEGWLVEDYLKAAE